jgi:hypothetical protein
LLSELEVELFLKLLIALLKFLFVLWLRTAALLLTRTRFFADLIIGINDP